MNARQARRIAMWLDGNRILSADHAGLSDEIADAMSETDLERIREQRRRLGLELLVRSAIDPHLTPEQALLAVQSSPLPRHRR